MDGPGVAHTVVMTIKHVIIPVDFSEVSIADRAQILGGVIAQYGKSFDKSACLLGSTGELLLGFDQRRLQSLVLLFEPPSSSSELVLPS